MNWTAILFALGGLLAGGVAGWWVRGYGLANLWEKVKPAGGALSGVLGTVTQFAGVLALCLMLAPNFSGCEWKWPTPGPTPTPIPTDGFKVAFVIESADTLTKEQHTAIYGAATRDYLNAKAKDWRVFDKDDKPSEKFWQDVLARPRTGTPWVFATNGKQTLEAPIPATGIVDLLKKYGG